MFYNEFLYQQHKSLLERVQKCEIEENKNIEEHCNYHIDENKEPNLIQEQNDQILKTGEMKSTGTTSNISCPINKRNYSSTSESEIDSTKKSAKNLRRKRTRRCLSKKLNSEGYETSSTSSAYSETELNILENSENNKMSHKGIKNLEETKENLQQKNEAFDGIDTKKDIGNSKTLKIEVNRRLPENLRGLRNSKQDFSKRTSKIETTSEKFLCREKNKFQVYPTQPLYQSHINSQHLIFDNQYQNLI
ncbi:hypothetical protein ACKWTF_011612 [Chironomus riparius]